MHHKILTVFFVLVIVTAGCATTEPTRYFQLDLKLEINNKPYDVTYNWHCREVLDGPNFGPGGILKARWEISPPTNVVLKKIENNAVFLFRPTLYCGNGTYGLGTDGSSFKPPITVIDSIINPTVMQIFTQQKTHGIRYDVFLKSGTIRRLEKSAPDYVASEEEKHLKQLLQDNSHGYYSVSARVIPESVWGKSDAVNQYFRNVNGIVIAPTPTGHNGRNNFFPVNWAGVFPLSEPEEAYTVPLIKSGNIWQSPATNDFGIAMIYYAQPESLAESSPKHYGIGSPPTATVDYDGTSIQVFSSQQIFDSKRKLLIQFINSYQPLPWIGNRE